MKDLFFLVLTGFLGLIYSFLLTQSDRINPSILKYLWIAVVVSATIFVVRILSYLLIDILFRYSQDKEPSGLLRLLVSTFLAVFAALFLLKFVFQEEILTVIAASTVVAAVAGFALQATLGNLFEGVALQLEQSFHIGDKIQVGDTFGTVQALTWRSIVIRTLDDSLMVIPNSQMSHDTVEVFPALSLARRPVTFPVPIFVPPQEVIDVVNETVRSVPNVSVRKNPHTRIVDFEFVEDQTVAIYETRYTPEDIDQIRETDGLVRKWIWYALVRHGVGMYLPAEPFDAGHSSLTIDHETGIATSATPAWQAVSANPFFRTLSAEKKEQIIQQAKRLVFGAGEPMFIRGPARYAMYLIAQGHVKAHLPMDMPALTPDSHQPSIAHGNSTPALFQWDTALLEKVTENLAYHIGPMARLFVKDAAHKTIDSYHLYHLLATEIEDATQRDAFLENAPAYPAVILEEGEYFGAHALFTGEPPVVTEFEAVGHTEVFQIETPLIRRLLQEDATLVTTFSRQLALSEREGFHALGHPPQEAAVLLEKIHTFYGITPGQT